MRFLGTTRFAILRAFFAAAVSAAVLSSAAVSGNAAQSGIAYNELMKFVGSDKPTPQPGNFGPDFQASVDAARAVANPPQHHGLFGKIQEIADMGKSAMSMYNNGMPSAHYFLNSWERTDDPGKQTATIVRPDRHQVIHLDLAKKTYRIEELGTPPPMNETPSPYQGPSGQQPSPQPGTGKLDISVSSTLLGPKTIDNVPTVGYSQDFKMTATQSTGSCQNGSFESSMIQYISNFAPPNSTNPVMKFHISGPMPTMGVAKPGCNLTTTTHHSGGAKPPADRLFLWMLETLKGGVQSNQGQASGSFSTLIERGNVRTLGPGDAGLFDIPAGFTKEQPAS